MVWPEVLLIATWFVLHNDKYSLVEAVTYNWDNKITYDLDNSILLIEVIDREKKKIQLMHCYR